jgi:hypothetical protein
MTAASEPAPTEHLTERQKKWFASVAASLERDTGNSLAEWATIALTCPETSPRARRLWLKEHYGLGANRAAQVLGQAFPSGMGWDEPDKLEDALWADARSRSILDAVEAAVSPLPELVTGQRKTFTAWSRRVQFAAIKPIKGGKAVLGIAVSPEADPRLTPPKNEAWSDRLKSKIVLSSPSEVDRQLEALIRAAWEQA